MLNLPFSTRLAGVSQPAYQEEVRQAQVGDPVLLERELSNPHDPNAITVRNRARRLLGYVPAAVAARFAELEGSQWVGRVDQVDPGQTWGMSVRIMEPIEIESTSPAAVVLEFPEPEPVEEVAEGEARHAYSVSGRYLGFVDEDSSDERFVTAEASDGVRVRYPAVVVRFRATAPEEQGGAA